MLDEGFKYRGQKGAEIMKIEERTARIEQRIIDMTHTLKRHEKEIEDHNKRLIERAKFDYRLIGMITVIVAIISAAVTSLLNYLIR